MAPKRSQQVSEKSGKKAKPQCVSKGLKIEQEQNACSDESVANQIPLDIFDDIPPNPAEVVEEQTKPKKGNMLQQLKGM